MPPFYVGYLKLPRGLRGFLIAAVACLLVLDVVAAFLVFRAQPAHPTGMWGVGEAAYTGRFVARPYPMVRVMDGPEPVVLLVGVGKEGAPDGLDGLDGQLVEVRGYPIMRGDLTVLQLDQMPARQDGTLPAASAPRKIGDFVMDGEVVDTKCYAGAMNPGDGKVHKGCASLCIFGGIPPLFVTKGEDGQARWFILADRGGGPIGPAVMPIAGDAIRLSGTAVEADGVPLFEVSPDALAALD
ncbi:MAG TPA: hypothetical protein VM689_17985 [Aliidongia sp.]|nr:hypothetical protein [Aliidongia sp.]